MINKGIMMVMVLPIIYKKIEIVMELTMINRRLILEFFLIILNKVLTQKVVIRLIQRLNKENKLYKGVFKLVPVLESRKEYL